MKLTDQQINEQNPTSLKVISELNIDCHQVTPIYNHTSPSQLSAFLGLELSYAPSYPGPRAQNQLRAGSGFHVPPTSLFLPGPTFPVFQDPLPVLHDGPLPPANITLVVQTPRTLPPPVPQVQINLNSDGSQSTKSGDLAFPVQPWLFPIVF